jgi:hypothetical protein
MCYIYCPSHPLTFDRSKCTIWGSHIKKLVIMYTFFTLPPFFYFISSELSVHKRYLNLPFFFLGWKTNLHTHGAQRSKLYLYMSLVCWIYQKDGTSKSHMTESRHPLKALRCSFRCEYTTKSSIFAHTIAYCVTASYTVSVFTPFEETRCLSPQGNLIIFRHGKITQKAALQSSFA